MHLHSSPCLQNDDRKIDDYDKFYNWELCKDCTRVRDCFIIDSFCTCKPIGGKEVVVTLKMDGENTSMYTDGFHARSLDSRHHVSRNWVRAFHQAIAADIPPDIRICGENLYAKHSIHYKNLEHYFQVFNIWNENDVALSWDDTVELCLLLGLTTVPVIYRGEFDPVAIQAAFDSYDDGEEDKEGYVVRLAEAIPLSEWSSKAAKWVRKGHVQTDAHWMHQAVIPNKLRQDVWETTTSSGEAS